MLGKDDIFMNDINAIKDFEWILSLSEEDLKKIFSQLSLTEIEDIITRLNEVNKDD